MFLVFLAIMKRAPLFHFLRAAAWVTLCLSPVLIILGSLTFITHKSRKGDSESVNAVKEVLAAKKERFCKLIEFS
jgi:hypothetical protein